MSRQFSRIEHTEYYSEENGAAAAKCLSTLPSSPGEPDAEANGSLKAYLQNGFSPETVETLLQSCVPSAFREDPDGAWSLHSLGQPEDSKKEECVSGFAAGLLNISGPVSIQIVKQPDQIPQFRILTASENETAVHGLLRSVFGQTELKNVRTENQTFKYSTSASITRCFEPEGKSVSRKETPEVNWPMRVLLSGVRGSYKLQMDLAPVEENILKDNFKLLCEVYGVCALASSPSSQVSGSRSNNTHIEGSFVEKVSEGIHTKEKLSTSDSISQSRSFSGKELIPELYQVQLKQLGLKYREAIDTGGWTVEIRAYSDDRATLRMLEAVMTGAFANTSFGLCWQEKKEDGQDSLWIARSDAEYFIQVPNENFPGFECRKNYKLSLSPPYESPENPLELGSIIWNNEKTDLSFVLPAMAYNRHAFVCGMTGGGKTNTIFHHLKHLKLPFLVIEPVKSEYHELSDSMPGLKTWNMNPASRNVLRINPFWFPRGSSLSYHLGSLKTIIASAFVLYSAMPNILEQCLTRVYIRCGWNIASGINTYDGLLPERYLYPDFSMLCEEIDQFLNESKYTGETLSTYQGALLTRLKVFTSGTKGILFNTADHPDYDRWRQQPVIVELDELSDDADKCIALGVLTLQYFESVRLAQKGAKEKNRLRHLLVIEEAHRLFKRSDPGFSDPESASSEQQLVETLSNMMAEIRAYGEGMFIVDQSPAKVAEDVIRNSSVKLIHRLDNMRDIEIIESSLRMQDASGLISTLMPGQALVSAEKMAHAALIQFPPEKDFNNEGAVLEEASKSKEGMNDTLINFVQADAALELGSVSNAMLRLADRFITSMLHDILTRDKLIDFVDLILLRTKEIIVTYSNGTIKYINNEDFLNRLMLRSLEKQLTIRFTENPVLAFKSAMLFERCIRLVEEGELTAGDVSVIDRYRAIQIWSEMREQFSISKEYSLVRNALRGRSAQTHWEIIRFGVTDTSYKMYYMGKNLTERREFLIQSLDRITIQPLEGVIKDAIVRDALDVADALYGKAN